MDEPRQVLTCGLQYNTLVYLNGAEHTQIFLTTHDAAVLESRTFSVQKRTLADVLEPIPHSRAE